MPRVTAPTPVPRRVFMAGAAATVAAAACSTSSRGAASPSSTTAPPSTASSSEQPPLPSFVSAGPRDRQQVALTFHVSGDPGLAARLLDLLKAHATPITAFVVGNWLEANPALASRFVDEGHELANHTYTHPGFSSLTRDQMTSEVTRCRDALTRIAGHGGDYFRPSGTANGVDDPGPTVIEVASAAGYPQVVGYDVDPADYLDPGATTIAERTRAALQPGSIVSLHFGYAGTIDALPAVITALDSRGLHPVVVRELLAS